MVRTLRYIIAVISATALVLGLVAATSMGANGTHRVVVQTRPVVDRTQPAAGSVVLTTAPPTTAAPTTTTPTTTAATTTAPTTAPPTTAPSTSGAPKPATPSTVARPAVVSAPAASSSVGAIGGNAGDFSLLGYRWDPCAGPVTVASSGPNVTAIAAELSSLTGLQVEMVSGPTADINLSWGSNLPGAEGGLTTWAAIGGWLSHITIVISPASAPYMSTVLHHEMGHAVGLGHAKQSNEVMYPIAHSGSPTDYQAGDRAGLRAIGVAAGCSPTPGL